MIRLIQRRLIIPRGDTGSFSIPVIKKGGTDNIAVFTIFDDLTRTKMFQKEVVSEGDVITIAFTHNDTVNLKPGKYYWDIKYYSDPQYVDEELVNGSEIDSYYAGYILPVCEIRETADNYLVSPDAPTATLSPTQLDIITSAINGLNEAIRKTNENVEHYPEIRDEVWYVWDAELGDYVSTDVPANGVVGNGIESAVLNNDYTLTLNFTDGTSFTSSSIRGETGNGIDDIVLNNDFTLTISYTDGESYTTPSIRGPVGATPQFSIGTVQEGAVAAASITGTAENPVLNLTLPNANVPTKVSELENDAGYLSDVQVDSVSVVTDGIANIPVAGHDNAGVMKVFQQSQYGVKLSSNYLQIAAASSSLIKAGSHQYRPIVPYNQHTSVFYGLAKSAGDSTQGASDNPVGTYTNEAKAAIQTMLDVPSNADVAAKQDTLTFDSAPTANSTNPVTSGGVYNAIANVNTMKIHICAQGEYDSETGIPTIQNPDTQTFYLVPGGEGNNLFIEWAYVNNAWERFGSADIDLSIYATKADTVLETTLSRGRKEGTTVGEASFAFGVDVEASGLRSHAEGYNTIASATHSHAEGSFTVASGANSHAEGANSIAYEICSHSEGANTLASSAYSHAEGRETIASGQSSHAQGYKTTANGYGMHAEGINNVPDNVFPEWVEGTAYVIGDKVTRSGVGYECKTANSDSNFKSKNWTRMPRNGYTAFVVGNGDPDGNSSNAYALDWDGNGHYAGDVYVHANADSTGGTKLATINDIPNVPVQDVQVNETSIVNQGIAGLYVGPGLKYGSQTIMVSKATDAQTKAGTDQNRPVVPYNQHEASFYGLAKAAGADMKDIPSTTVGVYPETSKTAIRSMLGAVGDVQVNGTSVVTNGAANVPIGGSDLGVVKENLAYGIDITSSGQLLLIAPGDNELKTGYAGSRRAITTGNQHVAAFYGLAKAAGHDEKNSTEPVGTYTPEAKGAIQSMLGVSDLIAPEENNLIASKAYAVGDVFTANGKLYKATAAIAADAAIIVDGANANCEETNVGEGFPHDVQVNGTSIVSSGVANVPVANGTTYGAVKADVYSNGHEGGIVTINGKLYVLGANGGRVKNGSDYAAPITAGNQHISTFYGLAKTAGDTTQAQSNNAVGTYTTEAKTAIRAMIGAENGDDIVKVQDTQPTTAATKIWLPETPPESIAVPTVAEMETALAGKVSDVQVNGTSVVSNGVANVPVAISQNTYGLIRVNNGYGLNIRNDGYIITQTSNLQHNKVGTNTYLPITPSVQDSSVFYGLAKAAGDATQSQSSNAVGNYTPSAKGAIQRLIGLPDIIAPDESSGDASRAYAEGEVFTIDGALYRATEAIEQGEAIVPPIEMMGNLNIFNCEPVTIGNYFIRDVQVNGTSVVTDGVANVPQGSGTLRGVFMLARDEEIKECQSTARVISPGFQHVSTFYGLAKAAGDTTQSASSNAVGTYTDNAKASIKSMLGIVDGSTDTVNVSGAAPTITAVENTRYVCGEVTSLNITPAASGICIIRFTSGTTPTVLTLPSTVKFPEWFDYSTLETDTIYEMCITDGIYGAVMSWAL